MKSLLPTLILLLAIHTSLYAAEKITATAPDGSFTVTQESQDGGEFAEIIRFRDPGQRAVSLTSLPWPGTYTASPDSRWLLRTQKTGSGESIAILYHVESNGRVSEISGFDDLLWAESDRTARLAKNTLHHTGIAKAEWSADNASLAITLSGSNASTSGDGVETRLLYTVTTHHATAVP